MENDFVHFEKNVLDDKIKPVMETFNLMAKKLAQSLHESKLWEESRKELVASISHDLHTPLTTIKAYVEGLIDNVANTPEKKSPLEKPKQA